MSDVIAGHQADYAQPYVIATPRGLWWRRLRIIPFRHKPSEQLVAIHEDITDVGQAPSAAPADRPHEQLLSALAHEQGEDRRSNCTIRRSHADSPWDLRPHPPEAPRRGRRGGVDRGHDEVRAGDGPGNPCAVLSDETHGTGARRSSVRRAAFRERFRGENGSGYQIPDVGQLQRRCRDGSERGLPRVARGAIQRLQARQCVSRGGAIWKNSATWRRIERVRIADDGRGISLLTDGELTVAPRVGFHFSMESRWPAGAGQPNIITLAPSGRS